MYCTKDDISAQIKSIDRYLRDPRDSGTEWEDRLTAAIENAGYEIDGYLASRIQLPVQTVPPYLKKLCVDVAIYNAMSFKGLKSDSEENTVYERYKAAVKFLEGVRDGKNVIDGLGQIAGKETAGAYGATGFRSPRRVLDGSYWRGY